MGVTALVVGSLLATAGSAYASYESAKKQAQATEDAAEDAAAAEEAAANQAKEQADSVEETSISLGDDDDELASTSAARRSKLQVTKSSSGTGLSIGGS